LRGALPDVVRGVVGVVIGMLLGGGVLVRVASAAVEALAGRSLRQLLMKWGIVRNETVECLRNIVDTAKEASQYIDDEGLRDVVEEVAKKWGWDVDTFKHFIKTAAGKSITEDKVKKMIEEALEKIKEELNEELNKVKTEVEGLLVGVKAFFIDDIENGLLYGNFKVKDGIPKIATLLGTAKNELVTDLVDAGRFREVAEDVFSRLVKDGRVVLIGPRGIGKSTLATYVTWRSLLGGLGDVVLDKLMDAVIRVDSLNPGDAAKLNNLVEATGRRFVVIYDPSPIEAYIEPESMGETGYDIKSIMKTLKELLKIRNTWVIVVLPKELYDEVSKSEELRNILDEIKSYIIDVDLKDEEFLREIIKRYSECNDVSDDLVKGVMGFDSYTLVAKYAGIWLRERRCEIKEVNEALRESAGEPKLFFANYVWNTILGKSTDLARRVSVPLILHAAFGPIPEGFAYIMKALSEGGVWRLIDRDRLAKSKLEDLREADLEPIAKWLSALHEDLIEEALEELAGLRGKEARKHYMDHGLKRLIETLDWGYKKALGEGRKIGESSVKEFMKNLVKELEQLIEDEDELKEVRELVQEVKPEVVKASFLLISVSERLKNALKPYANCFKRAALIIGLRLGKFVGVPRPEDMPEDLFEDVAESLGEALRRCSIDDYLLIGNEIPPLIGYLIDNHADVLAEAFIDKYGEVVAEINRIYNIFRIKGGHNGIEELYGLGLAIIIARAAEMGTQIEPKDADVALHIASFLVSRYSLPHDVTPKLRALKPLRDKAPHRYIQLLNFASNIMFHDLEMIEYIFHELNEVLDKYGQSIEEHAYSLVYAIGTYAVLLNELDAYFKDEVGGVYDRIADLLNKLGRLNSVLGIIAWAYALAPVLPANLPEHVRELMAKKLGVNVVDKTIKVLKELGKLMKKKNVRELMGDKEFMSFVESFYLKADERTVRRTISGIKHYLKIYAMLYRPYIEEAWSDFEQDN